MKDHRTSRFQRLHQIINNRFFQYLKKVKTVLNLKTEYKYSNFSISLPADHLLPTFQKYHNLYDRFLPRLSRYLDSKSTVIDVGANCGDTLAAMYDGNKNLTFICIEPDESFFEYLQQNALRIKEIDKTAKIQTIKSLIGKNITDVSLDGSGGTKKAIFGDNKNTISSQSLDYILSLRKFSTVSLLKSDVDGFDYDVIDSAESIIKSYLPIIFFECQLDHIFQKTGYEKTIADLKLKGYTEWIIFDNFGEVVVRTDDIQQIYQLLNYIWRQNNKRSTRTIYYYDILAFTKKDNALINKVMNDYFALNV